MKSVLHILFADRQIPGILLNFKFQFSYSLQQLAATNINDKVLKINKIKLKRIYSFRQCSRMQKSADLP